MLIFYAKVHYVGCDVGNFNVPQYIGLIVLTVVLTDVMSVVSP